VSGPDAALALVYYPLAQVGHCTSRDLLPELERLLDLTLYTRELVVLVLECFELNVDRCAVDITETCSLVGYAREGGPRRAKLAVDIARAPALRSSRALLRLERAGRLVAKAALELV
jgi:hypothetical protein